VSVSCKYTGVRLAMKSFKELHSHVSYSGLSSHCFPVKLIRFDVNLLQENVECCKCSDIKVQS
jgi:hypothetical protein